MIDFLKKIASAIVDNPQEVEIKVEKGNDFDTYTLVVPEDQIGRIIGKGGKVIAALRTLSRLKANKEQKRVFLKIEDNQGEKGFSLPNTTGASEAASSN